MLVISTDFGYGASSQSWFRRKCICAAVSSSWFFAFSCAYLQIVCLSETLVGFWFNLKKRCFSVCHCRSTFWALTEPSSFQFGYLSPLMLPVQHRFLRLPPGRQPSEPVPPFICRNSEKKNKLVTVGRMKSARGTVKSREKNGTKEWERKKFRVNDYLKDCYEYNWNENKHKMRTLRRPREDICWERNKGYNKMLQEKNWSVQNVYRFKAVDTSNKKWLVMLKNIQNKCLSFQEWNVYCTFGGSNAPCYNFL